MIRENNVTMEYEFEGEKIKYTTDEKGKIIKVENEEMKLYLTYDEFGIMRTNRTNKNNETYKFLSKWIFGLPVVSKYGKLISYTIELDKLDLIVTLDSNDKVTKIKGKDFEYEYEYNEVNKVYDIIIKDSSLIVSPKLIDNTNDILTTVLEALVLIKSLNNNTSNKLYKGSVNTKDLNNFTFNNKPDMRGNIMPNLKENLSKIKLNKGIKDPIYDRVKQREYIDTINKRYVDPKNIIPSKYSHFDRLSQILYDKNKPLVINTKGGDKMNTNKNRNNIEEILFLDSLVDYRDELLKDFHKNKELKGEDKMSINKSKIDLEELEDKIKCSPDEFPGFFKDPKVKELENNKKVMLSDLFKLEKAIQVIKLLEEDYSSSFSLNEIKEIALNSTVFDKYGKDNFSIEIFNRDCVQKIIASKNVKVTTVFNRDNDCTVGYYDNIVQKVTIHPDFNINKKYAFLIDNTTSKTITLLLYIPSHYPITHSDDVMRIIKEYGLE